MANEINITANLSGAKNGKTAKGEFTGPQTLAGTQVWTGTQVLQAGNWELLAFPGDLTTEGISYLWGKNEHASNYIELATDGAGANKFAKIPGGKPFLIPPATGNPSIYGRANATDISLGLCAVGT